MRVRPPNASGIAMGVFLAVALTAGAAVAQGLITSADIKNNTIQSVDVKDGNLTSADIKNGTIQSADVKDGNLTSADIKNGTIQSADVKDGTLTSGDILNETIVSGDIKNGTVNSGDIQNGTVSSADVANGTLAVEDLSAAAVDSLTGWTGEHWSIIDRNVIGAGDSFLRAGPSVGGNIRPPLGVGSLGIRTGSADDKATFGNQVEFRGMDLNTVVTLTYQLFTTGENNDLGNPNTPNLQFEIDAQLGNLPLDDFTTAVHTPDGNTPGGLWTVVDTINSGVWHLTGAEGDETGCTLATPCAWAALLTALDDGGDPPFILTAQFNKGRDFAFSGAVDALVINEQTVDFEPNGVFVTP